MKLYNASMQHKHWKTNHNIGWVQANFKQKLQWSGNEIDAVFLDAKPRAWACSHLCQWRQHTEEGHEAPLSSLPDPRWQTAPQVRKVRGLWPHQLVSLQKEGRKAGGWGKHFTVELRLWSVITSYFLEKNLRITWITLKGKTFQWMQIFAEHFPFQAPARIYIQNSETRFSILARNLSWISAPAFAVRSSNTFSTNNNICIAYTT